MSNQPHRFVYFITYDGFELIDLAGPESVFNMANTLLNFEGYQLTLVSVLGGAVRSSSGMELETQSLVALEPKNTDIILVMGGVEDGLQRACRDPALLNWLNETQSKVSLVGSVCTGAFIIASAGLLDGCSATTHWADRERLGRLHKQVDVISDALYIADNKRWTSAGGTAGVDMALALVSKDFGAELAARIARRLVVYLHRPGNQSQFSDFVNAQIANEGQFSKIISWIEQNLSKELRVDDLATRANLSSRSFHRKFSKATGLTPLKFVELCRMERAKKLLETGMPTKSVAVKVGYRSVSAFGTAYRNRYGVSPAMQAMMHSVDSNAKQ